MEEITYKDDKAFEKISQIFLSSIFARKHENIYLSRSNPFKMYCSTVSPDTMFAEARNINDVVHRVDSKGHNLFKMWETRLPMPNWDNVCISKSGMDRLKKLFKTDLEVMKNEMHLCPITGMLYVNKEKKLSNDRVTIIQIPIVWPISSLHFNMLEDTINGVTLWVDRAKHHRTILVSKDDMNRGDFTLIPIESEDGFGKGIRIPIADGFNSVSIVEYLKRANIMNIEMIIGHHGQVVRYYCKSSDPLSDTLSVLPAAYYFSINNLEERKIEHEY